MINGLAYSALWDAHHDTQEIMKFASHTSACGFYCPLFNWGSTPRLSSCHLPEERSTILRAMSHTEQHMSFLRVCLISTATKSQQNEGKITKKKGCMIQMVCKDYQLLPAFTDQLQGAECCFRVCENSLSQHNCHITPLTIKSMTLTMGQERIMTPQKSAISDWPVSRPSV